MPYGDRPRPRNIFPATPFLFLQNRTSILEWNTSSLFVWDTEAVNTQDFKYVIGKSKIFILTSGYYEIAYDVSVYVHSGARDYILFAIYQNGLLMPGSLAYAAFPDGTYKPTSMSATHFAYLDSGDYLQLYTGMGGGAGTLRTPTNSVRFIIKFMPQQGWDNSSGGAENYRGGVSR